MNKIATALFMIQIVWLQNQRDLKKEQKPNKERREMEAKGRGDDYKGVRFGKGVKSDRDFVPHCEMFDVSPYT